MATPMVIDSPLPNGKLGAGGIPPIPTTAKVTDMISIFRPTKVRCLLLKDDQMLMELALRKRTTFYWAWQTTIIPSVNSFSRLQ